MRRVVRGWGGRGVVVCGAGRRGGRGVVWGVVVVCRAGWRGSCCVVLKEVVDLQTLHVLVCVGTEATLEGVA